MIDSISQLFAKKVPQTYIADGHHRAASAAKVRKELGSKTEASDYFLPTLFPSNQLYIMDYNRVVKDLNGLDKNGFLQKLEKHFTVEKVSKALSPEKLH